MGVAGGDMFECEYCGGEFLRNWTDAEAQAEYEANFPLEAGTGEAMGLVCDDCYAILQLMVETSDRAILSGLCGDFVERCICLEPAGHAPITPHLCPCKGSWTGKPVDGTFEVVAYPCLPAMPGLNIVFDNNN